MKKVLLWAIAHCATALGTPPAHPGVAAINGTVCCDSPPCAVALPGAAICPGRRSSLRTCRALLRDAVPGLLPTRGGRRFASARC